MTTLLLDGFGPLPIERPTTMTELCASVRQANTDRYALYPFGGRTMLDQGGTPTRPGVALDLTALNDVIDYPARDMTITVQAGITVANLQAILAREGQHLPVDVSLPDRATLGGAVATNASGPRRFGFGTLRDYVIGISIVNDAGDVVKAGGRVVKNVAGYDLMKLFTGSFGTLGIVSQVTLKVPPQPEAFAIVRVACPAAGLKKALNEILPQTKTRPVAISVLNSLAAPTDFSGSDYVLAIAYEEQAKAVSWQIEQLRQELPPSWVLSIHEHSAARTVLATLRDWPLKHETTFKASVLPARTAWFLQQASARVPNVKLLAHAGNGIVHGAFPEGLPLTTVQHALTDLLNLATAEQGNLIVPRCPTAWKSTLPVWGRPTADQRVMQAIKAKLDPRRCFNPGRFVGGI